MLLLLACKQPDVAPDPDPAPDRALIYDGDTPTNLLMISVDTLRKTSLEEGYAPFLASLEADSVVADANTTCSSSTEPGTICALSGFRAEELGALPRAHEEGAIEPDPAIPTLASWLGEAGFHTTMLSANAIHRGEFYSGDYQQAYIVPDASASSLVDAALAVPLEEPWMLHVHFFDPHEPYYSEDACLGDLKGHPTLDYDLTKARGLRAVNQDWETLSADEQAEVLAQLRIRYFAQVTCMDAEIQRMWDTLEAAGLLENTLVSVWTDHGEQLLDHGAIGHGSTMWPEVNDGLMFWWAANLQPQTFTNPTTLQDLVPTTMRGLGLEAPEVSGIDVAQSTEDRVTFGTVHSTLAEPEQQVTRRGVRLRYNWEGRKRLYRHKSDPDENSDAYDSENQDTIALWDELMPEVEDLAALYADDQPKRTRAETTTPPAPFRSWGAGTGFHRPPR